MPHHKPVFWKEDTPAASRASVPAPAPVVPVSARGDSTPVPFTAAPKQASRGKLTPVLKINHVMRWN